MVKKLSIYLSLGLFCSLFLLVTTHTVITKTIPVQTVKSAKRLLKDFAYQAASVLPVYYNSSGELCVLLAREAVGNDAGTYDDFGGSRDTGENHPVITAAREFYEEINAQNTLGLSCQKAQHYIDLSNHNTKYVIVYNKTFGRTTIMVTHITEFSHADIEAVHKKFYSSAAQQKAFCMYEKDTLAAVKWADLKASIAATGNKVNAVMVKARVDKKGAQPVLQDIELRPIFVRKLQQFFKNAPYQQGDDARVQFYQQ